MNLKNFAKEEIGFMYICLFIDPVLRIVLVSVDVFIDGFTDAGGAAKSTGANRPANPRSHANCRKDIFKLCLT